MTKSALAAFFCLTVALSPLEAQTPGTPAPGGTGTTPPVTPGSRTPGGTGNTTNPNNQRGNPAPSMPVYISGKVMVSDGSPLPHGITIKSICLNRQRTVANADTKGYISFQWGHETSVVPDASDRGLGRNATAATAVGADDVIAAHHQMFDRAHSRGIKVIGATLAPFEGAGQNLPVRACDVRDNGECHDAQRERHPDPLAGSALALLFEADVDNGCPLRG